MNCCASSREASTYHAAGRRRLHDTSESSRPDCGQEQRRVTTRRSSVLCGYGVDSSRCASASGASADAGYLGKPPTGDGWAVEWKFDGRVRLIVIDDGVTVYSRNGADFYSLGVLGWGRIRTINVSARHWLCSHRLAITTGVA